MKKSDLPSNEAARLAVLAKLQPVSHPGMPQSERITRVARNQFNVPIVWISRVDQGSVWMKMCDGLHVSSFVRGTALCSLRFW